MTDNVFIQFYAKTENLLLGNIISLKYHATVVTL